MRTRLELSKGQKGKKLGLSTALPVAAVGLEATPAPPKNFSKPP